MLVCDCGFVNPWPQNMTQMSASDLTQLDVVLLENVLDALDRLFDFHSKAIDVCALLQATAHALSQTHSMPY
jgi:hypothetical protein